MWKASVQKAVKEVRFVLKPSADHHGVWKFVRTTLPEIRSLNPNTFFQVQEITDQFKTESACHVIYGDGADRPAVFSNMACVPYLAFPPRSSAELNTEDVIPSSGITAFDFEKMLKAKVEFGLTLSRAVPKNNDELDIPVDIVEARKYVKHIDDAF